MGIECRESVRSSGMEAGFAVVVETCAARKGDEEAGKWRRPRIGTEKRAATVPLSGSQTELERALGNRQRGGEAETIGWLS